MPDEKRMVTLVGGPRDGETLELPLDAIGELGTFKVVEPASGSAGPREDDPSDIVRLSESLVLTAHTYRLYAPTSTSATWVPEPRHLEAEREGEADEFVQHVYALVEYWKKQDDPVAGVAFSILVLLDGGAAPGPYELRTVPEDAAITWRRGPDIAGELHERFSRLGREQQGAASTEDGPGVDNG